jgi:thiol-disulfide isomerase/thioredoxin
MDIRIRTAAIVASLVLVAAVAIAIYPLVTGGRGLSLTATTTTQPPLQASGPVAPEFVGIVDWENSPSLKLATLRGKVVLVDFWTYSCVNCQRTIPFLRQWWDKYSPAGLVIVGVHSPEFDFEKNLDNVRRAIKDYGVTWPVAVDSNMATWNAYSNHYWPAEYLIDKSGRIRHTHFGEGEYDVTERAIQALLAEGGSSATQPLASADPGITSDARMQTPELYAGSERGDGTIQLTGSWAIRPQFAEHVATAPSGRDYAQISYQARRVFLVAGATGVPVNVWVTLDGHDLIPSQAGSAVKFDASGRSYLVVDHDDLYALVSLTRFGRHELRISPDQARFQLYTFTFGS